MASSLRLRSLSTAAAASGSSISFSQAKSKLRTRYDPDKALEIYSSVSKPSSSPTSPCYALHLTVRRLAKSRRFSAIESLLESHKSDPNIKHEPFVASLIRSYGLAGMFSHALTTFEQMNEFGTPRSSLSFNALLLSCSQSKLFDRVPDLFYDISSKYGVSPDKFSYGILVKSFCEAGRPERAIETLGEMEEKGVEVTAVTYSTILSALYKKGKAEEAERIWVQMVESGCEVDAAAYNVKMMHAQSGDPEGVEKLMEEMEESGLKPDTISYNFLMTCYFKNGMMEKAKKVYAGLEENGCSPNATTFRTLVYHLCRSEEYETAFEVFRKSVVMHKIPDFNTLKYLAEGLVKEKKMKEAKELIQTVKMKFPPNFLNAWKKVEKNLCLASTNDTAEDEYEEDHREATA